MLQQRPWLAILFSFSLSWVQCSQARYKPGAHAGTTGVILAVTAAAIALPLFAPLASFGPLAPFGPFGCLAPASLLPLFAPLPANFAALFAVA